MILPRKRIQVASVGLAVLMAGSVVAAPAAMAGTSSFAACVGTTADTYHPGLTFIPRMVHFHAADTFPVCTSSDPALTSGTDVTDVDLELSCAEPVLAPAKLTVHWNNGRSSTLSFSTVVEGSGQTVVTASGTVTEGEFAGAAVTAQYSQLPLDPQDCLSDGGVTNVMGTASLQIIGG
jgi:hypothetical protein